MHRHGSISDGTSGVPSVVACAAACRCRRPCCRCRGGGGVGRGRGRQPGARTCRRQSAAEAW